MLKWMRFALFVAVTSVAVAAPAAASDGPYIMRSAAGLETWTVEDAPDGARKHVAALKEGATVTVPAVGRYPPFNVKLRAAAAPAADAVTTPAKTPVFVVADTHGEFEILAQMLVNQKILDAKLRWAFGPGHLVVLGDVFDRGPNHLEILWLLYELEAQAAKAGGGVHLVLGNHETMIMRGDQRYLNPKYVETAGIFGVPYPELFTADTVLGQWLRTRPVMFAINGNLCLHGGVSRALTDRKLTLAQINATARASLSDSLRDDDERERATFLFSLLGPLWYRGYFADQRDFPIATQDDVAAALSRFGARRILIGHTMVPTITPLYEGKVIAVQVYPKREDATHVTFESLLIRGGKLFRATPDGTAQPL